MQSQYRLHKAYKLLEAADRAFEEDETSPEGARLMWEATVAGLSDVAKNRGWPHKTTEDVKLAARQLDKRKEDRGVSIIPNPHFINLTIAEMFLEQSEWLEKSEWIEEDGEWSEFRWEDYNYQDGRKALKKYLYTLETLAQRGSVIR